MLKRCSTHSQTPGKGDGWTPGAEAEMQVRGACPALPGAPARLQAAGVPWRRRGKPPPEPRRGRSGRSRPTSSPPAPAVRSEPRNVYRSFTRVAQSAGLRVIRLHDARHGTATLLTVAGVAPRVVMEILGQATSVALPQDPCGMSVNVVGRGTPGSSVPQDVYQHLNTAKQLVICHDLEIPER
jgi:hypothetical protein